jgi:cyclopropane-fatty-acyl-phospholipid synthase
MATIQETHFRNDETAPRASVSLEKIAAHFIKVGRLTIICADGRVVRVGKIPDDAPDLDVVIRLKGSLTAWKLALRPDLYFGEAYADGSLVIEQGSLWGLFDLCGRNLGLRRPAWRGWPARIVQAIGRQILHCNSRRAARRNAAHHYDLSEDLFRAFLDEDMQYSCAYFREPDLALDEAQVAKKRHIVAKLLLEPGQRVLDIGCGWGGLALSIARTQPVSIIGITLSQEQLTVAKQRAAAVGLDIGVTFELQDYREIDGLFDRIVSVGMFEHVGRPNYQNFFKTIARLMTDDGVALIHSIGRMDGPSLINAWTRKHIFPGGYIPALSEVLPAVERAGLWITDIEILRLHYAETLRHWRERFLRHSDLVRQTYDGRFCRLWEFYLAGSEMAFRYGGLMVFQLQLSKRIDTVPLTRDYLFAQERHHDGVEGQVRQAAGAR